MRRCLFLALALLAAPAHATEPGPLPPPDLPMERVIDQLISRRLAEEKVTPAPQADDATLIRRLTLDLVGRIPTPAETREYVLSREPDKRIKLVDRLMSSPSFVRYQALLFDAMMTPQGSRGGAMRDYFARALADRRPWDQIFRELMLPDETKPATKGTTEFLRGRINDLDRVTNDVSVLFFGVNVSCAQCHNHPLVADWKQDHYYGMKAFLSRTFDNGGQLAEREFGVVKFKPPKGPEKPARMMFLTGSPIDHPSLREPTKEEASKERERFEQHKKDKTAPPPPAFSARAKLVELALADAQSQFFARNIANRLWHRFTGRGFVMPLDQMHSENPPSHPELLSWLARDLTTHQYDLRRLVRGIVLSETYSRASKQASPGEAEPEPHLFAVAKLRALTPTQLTTSMRLALSEPTQWNSIKPADLEQRALQFEQSGADFASRLVMPTDDFQIGVAEALLFTNSERVTREYLTDGKETLLGSVKDSADRAKSCEQILQSVYCRKPTPDEVKALTDYLDRRSDRLPEAYRQILWALLTSAEFRFNY